MIVGTSSGNTSEVGEAFEEGWDRSNIIGGCTIQRLMIKFENEFSCEQFEMELPMLLVCHRSNNSTAGAQKNQPGTTRNRGGADESLKVYGWLYGRRHDGRRMGSFGSCCMATFPASTYDTMPPRPSSGGRRFFRFQFRCQSCFFFVLQLWQKYHFNLLIVFFIA